MAADEARALSMRVQALREQRADISRQIAQSHNAADRRKQNERRRPKTFGITEYQERLVSAIYILSGCKSLPAAHKFMHLQTKGAKSLSFAEAERTVEDIFLTMPDDFPTKVWDPLDAAMKRICSAAHSFLAEFATFEWVANQNEEHGVAPSSVAARTQYEESLGIAGLASTSCKSARRWVRRWRRRWPVTRGKLQVAEPLAPGEIEAKAARS